MVFKDIHEMHKDFAFQFLFADLIYGKILNLGNQWTVEFLCWKFYEWNISCLFFFNCQDILSFFYHISDSLQISSTFKFICFKMQRKKSFCLVQYILCYRNPPIKQTCWQWLAEAQLFRHLWIRLWLPGSYQCISAGRKTFKMHQ